MVISDKDKGGEYTYNGQSFYGSNFNLEWVSELSVVPKVILDIGAYDFGDAIRFKLRYPQSNVYAFEADKNRFDKTSKYAEQCGVQPFHAAVYNKSGSVNFYPAICHLPSGGSLHKAGENGAQGSLYKITQKYKTTFKHISQSEEPITVDCVTINDFCIQKKIESVDIAHIDVEGAEFDVIKGLGPIRPTILYIETQVNLFKNNTTIGGINDLLVNMGYTLLKDFGTDRLYAHL